MFKLQDRPYNLLLITAIPVLVISFFVMNESFDIHLHDAYYVISAAFICWGIALLLVALWGLYLMTRRILFRKSLTWAHVLLTVAASLLFLAFCLRQGMFEGLAGMPRRYIDYNAWDEFESFSRMVTTSLVTVAILGLSQLIFLINIIAGAIAPRR